MLMQRGKNLQALWAVLLPMQLVVIMAAIGLVMGVGGAMLLLLLRGDIAPAPLPPGFAAPAPVVANRTSLAPTFTKEVLFWADNIMRWANEYGIEPNLLATVIQIESCGHYLIGSNAGAQGLFQVMPFHFSEGENMLDPDTNAKRGINYLIGGLQLADGHIGLAMAGYNGGWGVIPRGWGRWAQETRNYYYWGSALYMDALNNVPANQSQALQSWLNAGGSRLCDLAATVLNVPLQASPVVQPISTLLAPPATSGSVIAVPPTITPGP
jgi:Transglycosylase SLT domain